jgi:branched-chain amino acid transport system substrate-binding protein
MNQTNYSTVCSPNFKTYLYRWIRRALLLCALGFVVHAHAQPKVLKIGMSVPLTGAQAPVGADIKAGAEAAIAAYNRLKPKAQLALIALDDGFVAQRSLENAKNLVENEAVVAMLTQSGTENALAVAPYLMSKNVALVGPSTGASEVFQPENRSLFVTRASYKAETDKMVNVLGTISAQRIGVLVTKDTFGQSVSKGLFSKMQERSLKPIATVEIERNSTDLGTAVKELVSASPTAIILIAVAKPSALFIKEARKAGYTGSIYALSLVASSAFIKDVGTAGDGLVITRVTPTLKQKHLTVVASYLAAIKQLGQEPSLRGLESYIATRTLLLAINSLPASATASDVYKRLTSINADLGGYRVKFTDTNRSGSEFADIMMLNNRGEFVN